MFAPLHSKPNPSIASQIPPSQKQHPSALIFEKLQSPETLNTFQDTWIKVFNIHRNYSHSERFSINMLDYILTSRLQVTAETVLGIYRPNSAKRQDDIVIGHLQEREDLNASIQLLKRASRSIVQSASITSSSSTLTAMEECSNHYTKHFNRYTSSSVDPSFRTCSADDTIGIPTLNILIYYWNTNTNLW